MPISKATDSFLDKKAADNLKDRSDHTFPASTCQGGRDSPTPCIPHLLNPESPLVHRPVADIQLPANQNPPSSTTTKTHLKIRFCLFPEEEGAQNGETNPQRERDP